MVIPVKTGIPCFQRDTKPLDTAFAGMTTICRGIKHGTLLSISVRDFSGIGNFYATTIAKIFNGAKPRQLSQVFENPPKFAINMETAKIIGYNPPIAVLSAVDEIHHEISVAK